MKFSSSASRWDGLLESSVVGSFTSVGYKIRSQHWDDLAVASLQGKVVDLTAGTSGIGKEVATQLANAGARLRLVARNREKVARLQSELRSQTGNQDIGFYLADLSLIGEVLRVADEIADQDLVGRGCCAESRGLDHGRAKPVAVLERRVARTDSDTDVQVLAGGASVATIDRPLHLDGAVEGVGGTGVRRHHRVTDRLDERAVRDRDRLIEIVEVQSAKVVGCTVANRAVDLGRTDDVGEENRHQSRCAHQPIPRPSRTGGRS